LLKNRLHKYPLAIADIVKIAVIPRLSTIEVLNPHNGLTTYTHIISDSNAPLKTFTELSIIDSNLDCFI
jgi:hypothetical protein